MCLIGFASASSWRLSTRPGRTRPPPRARPRADRAPRPARLGRGVDRRAPLGWHRDHRLAGDLHRGCGRRANPPHQARHRRGQRQLPQPAVGRRARRAARPPDPRSVHARARAGVTADRRGHDRARPEPDPRSARRRASTSSCSCCAPTSRSPSRTTAGTLRDARLHLRPYSDPLFDVSVAAVASPTGPQLAGKHGIGLLSIGRHPGRRVRCAGPALGRHGGAGGPLRHDRRPRASGGWSG